MWDWEDASSDMIQRLTEYDEDATTGATTRPESRTVYDKGNGQYIRYLLYFMFLVVIYIYIQIVCTVLSTNSTNYLGHVTA